MLLFASENASLPRLSPFLGSMGYIREAMLGPSWSLTSLHSSWLDMVMGEDEEL